MTLEDSDSDLSDSDSDSDHDSDSDSSSDSDRDSDSGSECDGGATALTNEIFIIFFSFLESYTTLFRSNSMASKIMTEYSW